MEELKRQFGRPDIIVSNFVAQLQTQRPPSTHHKDSFMEFSAFLNNLVEFFQSLGFHHFTSFHSLCSVRLEQTSTQKKHSGHNTSYGTTSLSLTSSVLTHGYAILPLPANISNICSQTFQQTIEQHSNENNRQKATEHQARRHPIKSDHTSFATLTSNHTTHLIAISSSSLPCKPNGSSSKSTTCA